MTDHLLLRNLRIAERARVADRAAVRNMIASVVAGPEPMTLPLPMTRRYWNGDLNPNWTYS